MDSDAFFAPHREPRELPASTATHKTPVSGRPILPPLNRKEVNAPEELNRVYNEVIGANLLMSAHPSVISTGPSMIPPPIPTSPEMMPIAMPNDSEGRIGGLFVERLFGLFLANSIRNDAQMRVIANMAWKVFVST